MKAVLEALDGVAQARSALPGQSMTVQSELGDVLIPEMKQAAPVAADGPQEVIKNHGIELLKVKSPDMIGSAQWSVLRGGRTVKVEILHKGWLDAYHRRAHRIQPGDSLRCSYEEAVTYDALGNEIDRKLSVVEVLGIVCPPFQPSLAL